MNRNALKRCLSVFIGCLVVLLAQPRVGSACAAFAVTYDSLLKHSAVAALVTTVSQASFRDRRYIYTDSWVMIETAIKGPFKKGDRLRVRTMGGVVDDDGQEVSGEATFTRGDYSLVFLTPGDASSEWFDVTARAQGQYPVALDERQHAVLHMSRAVGMLFRRPPQPRSSTGGLSVLSAPDDSPLASSVIAEHSVDEVIKSIARDWGPAHDPHP